MPRQRRIEIEEEEKDIYDDISEVLERNCGVPGCRPKFHIDDARDIIEALKARGYPITKGGG